MRTPPFLLVLLYLYARNRARPQHPRTGSYGPFWGRGDAVTFPAGERAASVDLLFHVPKAWEELKVFAPTEPGMKSEMSGMLRFPGDARTAADHYMEFLNEAGFPAGNYLHGEATNEASLYADGKINGQLYGAHQLHGAHQLRYRRGKKKQAIIVLFEDFGRQS